MSIKFVIVRRPKNNSNLPVLNWVAGNKKNQYLMVLNCQIEFHV